MSQLDEWDYDESRYPGVSREVRETLHRTTEAEARHMRIIWRLVAASGIWFVIALVIAWAV